MKKCLWLLAALLFVSGCSSDDAATSGLGGNGIVCQNGEHAYADGCEADSLASCGSHDNDCANLEGWKAGDCTGGKCAASECTDGYELKDGMCVSGTASPSECGEGKHSHEGACEDDSLENCGGHGNDCTKEEGWKAGDCTGGKCVASECAENFELKEGRCGAAGAECEAGKHAHEGSCEDDSDENCGSHGNKCAELEGWKAGACTDGKCVASECAGNFELKEGKCEAAGSECEAGKHAHEGGCEDDSDENCGSHGNKCAEREGWKAGACTDGKCVASECAENFELKEGKCEAAGSDCGAGKHAYDGGCEDDSDDNCGSHDNKCADTEGWKAGACKDGKCVASECASDYELKDGQCVKKGSVSCNKGEHVYQNGCEKDSVKDCGSHGNDCSAQTGWADGSCTDGKCVVTKCASGYKLKDGQCVKNGGNPQPQCKSNQHVWNGQCEDDTVEHCGKHDTNCATAVTGWADGNCTNKKCVLNKCVASYCISSGKCVAGASDIHACGVNGGACNVCAQHEICSNGVCESDIKCANNQHKNGDECEDNTNENCGAHGVRCDKTKVVNSTGANCTSGGACVPTGCKPGYIVSGNVCAPEPTCPSNRHYCAKDQSCCYKPNCEGPCFAKE